MKARKNPLNDKKPHVKYTRGVQTGTLLKCADNTGAVLLKIIGCKQVKGRLNKLPSATIGDVVTVCVKKGIPELRKKILLAVLIRQKKSYRRKDGSHIAFEDNAAIIINEKSDMKGSQISGPVPREVAEIYSKVSSHASSII